MCSLLRNIESFSTATWLYKGQYLKKKTRDDTRDIALRTSGDPWLPVAIRHRF